MTIEEFIYICEKFFRFTYKGEINDKLVFWYRDDEESSITISKEKLETLIASLSNYDVNEETELYNDCYYEVSVGQNQRIYAGWMRNGATKEDTVNQINYSIGSPSEKYLIFILNQLKQSSIQGFRRITMLRSRRLEIFNDENNDLLTIIEYMIPNFQTLQITSNTTKKISEFESLSYAFVFNLSYNLDIAFLPLRFIDEIFRTLSINRIRRSNIDEIETPKRKYINDLILYYQRGISSVSIDNQFLSYYHIIEHFFEKIYQQDIIDSIKKELTKPSFSYKKSKDIKSLVKVIKKKLRYRNEEFLLNEQEALFLTLKHFIHDLEEIKTELNSHDPTLISYYKNNEVSFSKGNKVDLDSIEGDNIFKHLSKRIYKTRNSIVHSKDSEFTKYLPYKNDKQLLKEIILMRVIAETIIIASSFEL